MNKSSSKAVPVARQSGARLRSLVESWQRSLKASNRADATTIPGYLKAVRYLLAYWERPDVRGPTHVRDVTRAHCEAYLADCVDRHLAGTTIENYYTLIKLFFAWCVDDEEIDVSPMARVRRPIVPDADKPAPVLTPQDVDTLLRACGGKTFADRRDKALLGLMFYTGLRRNEVYQMLVGDVDLNAGAVTIHRKGRKDRRRPFSAGTAAALDKYLRVRENHRHASNPALWLSQRGRLSYASIYRIVSSRAEAAGIGHIWPHVARHTFSGMWIKRGGDATTLTTFNDWSHKSAHRMIWRYTREQQEEMALEAYKRLAPGDQL